VMASRVKKKIPGGKKSSRARRRKPVYKCGMKIKKCEPLPAVKYSPHPKFGTIFGPHILRIDFNAEDLQSGRDLEAEITPFEGETFSPGTSVLHYGQSVFEGLKVFRQKDGTVAAFRADLHAQRFVKSAQRLAMPALPEKVFLEGLRAYMEMEKDSVPAEPDHALYIRPLMIARDEIIKIGKSKKYTFYIMSAIAGSYFPGGVTRGAHVLVNRSFVRAFPGGLGEVKTAGNYAASLMPQSYAETYNCDQVLYLDGAKHEFVDELGGMNFFVVRNNELITPNLNGCILNGVTRRSILELAPTLGHVAKEQPISFTEVLKDIATGRITEAFACGTAAVIHPIGEFVVQDKTDAPATTVKLPTAHPVAMKFLETIQGVQRGAIKAPGDWLFR
jgi:branched-chain amino acid aminotransferase